MIGLMSVNLAATGGIASVLLWSGLLAGGVGVGVVAVVGLRRWIWGQEPSDLDPPFTLEQLRQFYSSGQINREQYESMRSRMLGALSDGSTGQAVKDDGAGQSRGPIGG